MNIKGLPDIKEYSTDIEETLVNRSPLLRRKYKGKIKARTKPGRNRSIVQGGGMTHFTLIDTFNVIHDKYDTKAEALIGLNLMARNDQSVLIDREALFWLSQHDVFNNQKGFTAIQVIERLRTLGVLDKYSQFDHHSGIAREALVKQKRSLTRISVEILRYYIETSLLDLLDDIRYAYAVEDDTIYWPNDSVKQMFSEVIAQEVFQSQDIAMYRRRDISTWSAHAFKRLQEKKGLTYEFLEDISTVISPGPNKQRRDKIVKLLCKQYNIEIPTTTNQIQESVHNTQEVITNTQEVIEEQTEVQSEVEVNKESLELPLHKDSYMEDTVRTTTNHILPTHCLSDVESLPSALPDFLVPAVSHDLASLRSIASSLMVSETNAIDFCYNDALSVGVSSFLPKDASDARQQKIMLSNGCLPFEYRLFSPASPRLYSSQVDNLFYSRKEMRIAAMEGLGFVDVDLQNCHADFILAIWGDKLPHLKAALDSNSLWQYYEDYFTSKSLPFYKPFIKSLHHATFLTGGKRAYRNAWQRYNNQYPSNTIKKSTYDAIVGAFLKCPICIELKSLFNSIKKEWVGKVLTVPTGESFLVEDTNWALLKKIQKKEGKYKHMHESEAEGNFPTALAALLQSLEVSLMSYLIVRCQALFVPILWQHDGLTIKALYSNTIELMQQVVNEFCDEYLGGVRHLKLTVEHL